MQLNSCRGTPTRALASLETGLPSSGSVSFTATAILHQGSYMSIALIWRQPLCSRNISSTSEEPGWGRLPEACFGQVGRSFETKPQELVEHLSLPAEAQWARPEEEAGQHRQTIVAPLDIIISTGSSKLNCWDSLQLKGLHLFESKAVSSGLITALQE